MLRIVALAAFLIAGVLELSSASPAPPVLRIAAQRSGTLIWELDTIRAYKLDLANGFTIEIKDIAAGPAAQVAFQGGEADAIVSDWIWVARQRAAGDDFVFLPYSRAVGGLMVPEHSKARSLEDLRGFSIGVAGGPLDKSWILLRAYAIMEYGFDLADETEQVFGTPPLIAEIGEIGEVAGAVNTWHYLARMKVAGMRELISLKEVAMSLGLDPGIPLLGYVLRGKMQREHPELIEGLARASRQAKVLLTTDPAAWQRLRPLMNAGSDAEFEALKSAFLAGNPIPGPVNEAAANQILALMARIGGEDLVGDAKTLPKGLFVQPRS